MFSIKVPQLKAGQTLNALGLSLNDYRGGPSTLCGGCGHDSITAAIIRSAYELSLEPHRVAKLSGIGCSSKTPGYFLNAAHGFNAVHGRMPPIATGAYLANRELTYLAVSGDGDTGSIGLGHFMHAMRRRIGLTCIVENNGVYGLTKGQFSATSDLGMAAKKGDINAFPPLDLVRLGLEAGASFIARSFSGDKDQLVPLIKAALCHKGFALLDVLSPCVSFNNHPDSSKSYQYIREHEAQAAEIEDFVLARSEIAVDYPAGSTVEVQLHDGSTLILNKVGEGFDPRKKSDTIAFLEDCREKKQIPTGLLYIEENPQDLHDILGTVDRPLRDVPFAYLCPGSAALASIHQGLR